MALSKTEVRDLYRKRVGRYNLVAQTIYPLFGFKVKNIARIQCRHSHSNPGEEGDGPMMGWGMLAENDVEVRDIQANHVALLVKPYVEVLARELKAYLD